MTRLEIDKLISNEGSTRYCKQCNFDVPLSGFYVKSTKGDDSSFRFNSPCKSCHNVHTVTRKIYARTYHLSSKFGLTVADYDNMLESQEGSCAICGVHGETLSRKLAVDHCHSSGKIRGLLCANCNVGLGNFKDDEELLSSAITYLNLNK